LRQVRATALTMQDDLKSELGPEVGDLDLRSLHPRTFVQKHLFGEDDIEALKKIAEPLTSLDKDEPTEAPSVAEPSPEPEPVPLQKTPKLRYDVDAT
jgi:sec-independent protein translocase protein TatB